MTASLLDLVSVPISGQHGQDMSRYHLDGIWFKFAVETFLKRMLFPMPRTDDPSVFGRGTEHDFFGWQLGETARDAARWYANVCNLDMAMVWL